VALAGRDRVLRPPRKRWSARDPFGLFSDLQRRDRVLRPQRMRACGPGGDSG